MQKKGIAPYQVGQLFIKVCEYNEKQRLKLHQVLTQRP